jgi:hypothetical protein
LADTYDRFCDFDYILLQVTGVADEDQILLSIETYVDRPKFLSISFPQLHRRLMDGECINYYRALQVKTRKYSLLVFWGYFVLHFVLYFIKHKHMGLFSSILRSFEALTLRRILIELSRFNANNY